MGNIIDCNVSWFRGRGIINVLFDNIPSLGSLRFQNVGSYFFAIEDDYVRHFKRHGDIKIRRQDFKITKTDSSSETIWDPCMTTVDEINRMVPDLKCVLVRISDSIHLWQDRNFSQYGTVLVKNLEPLLTQKGFDCKWVENRWGSKEFLIL